MPLKYIRNHQRATNTLCYKLSNGDIKIRQNNVNYIYKKPRGVITGTSFTYDEVLLIYDLYEQGMKINALCRYFNISYYYFKKIKEFVQISKFVQD
jgi:hypothetical protein